MSLPNRSPFPVSRSPQKKARSLFIISFLAPAVLLYSGFVLYPLVQAVLLSFYRYRGVSGRRTFVGVENYQRLASDGVFWQALKNNLWLLVFAGAVIIALAVGVAHAMRGKGRLQRVLRSIYLFPQVVSMVVVAVMWQFIFNPEGLLNAGLRAIGLESATRTWLGDGSLALPAVAVAFIWFAVGFYIMLFAAGMQTIPEEVSEAAELDGSIGFHRFLTVTWPLLWSVRRTAVIYLVINVMNIFALVFLMTRGGPDRKSEVLLTYLYEQAFVNSRFGDATAVAVGNFVVVMALTLAILFYFRRNPVEARR